MAAKLRSAKILHGDWRQVKRESMDRKATITELLHVAWIGFMGQSASERERAVREANGK